MATRSPKEKEKGTEKTEAEQFKDRVRAAAEHGLLTTGTTKLGQREIVIGIPYRDDGWGEAIRKDVNVVAAGTACRVIVIPPGVTLNIMRVDALFFPGGPVDQPGTISVPGSRPRPARSPAQAEEALARHQRELVIIGQAEQKNIPILGVCGGSRRLATAKGATQIHLTPELAKVHTGDMGKVADEAKHSVAVAPGTILHRIIATGHYRVLPPAELRDKILEVMVNSVHWASSHFPGDTRVVVTAQDQHKIVEGFEDPRYHFQVGVQWHPEYAQLGTGDFAAKGMAEPHQRIMAALGQAALESHAANVIKRALLDYVKLRRAKSTIVVTPPSALVTTAKTTAAPVKTSVSPVTTIASPVTTIASPVRTIASPVRTIASPVRTIPSPVKTIPSPVKTASAPVTLIVTPARLRGRIVKWKPAEGYGFIDTASASYFFHVTSVISGTPSVNASATFRATQGQKGPVAKDVRIE